MQRILYLSILVAVFIGVNSEANFEDSRCRCVCPSTSGFVAGNHTSDNPRRYYTMTNLNPSLCTPFTVVKHEVEAIVDDTHMDAFLANCDCRYESRNTVMIKVVVIFVICVIMVLVTYMAFLMCLDPMLRKKRFQMPYRQQNDEMEDNIFASTARASSTSTSHSTANLDEANTMRERSSRNDVLGRVEAEQNRWMKKAEEQRRNVFEDHTMLN